MKAEAIKSNTQRQREHLMIGLKSDRHSRAETGKDMGVLRSGQWEIVVQSTKERTFRGRPFLRRAL